MVHDASNLKHDTSNLVYIRQNLLFTPWSSVCYGGLATGRGHTPFRRQAPPPCGTGGGAIQKIFGKVRFIGQNILYYTVCKQTNVYKYIMEGQIMKEREELKRLISEMNEAQFEWFISQMRRVLSEEVAAPDRQKANRQNHT